MVKNSTFEAKFPAFQCSYGHKLGTGEPPITIRSYMPSLVKILWAVFEKPQKKGGLWEKNVTNSTLKINFFES